MTAGRTTLQWRRLYVDGYDLSSELRNIGPLSQAFDEAKDDAVLLTIKKTWPVQCSISPGTLNAIFDTTAVTGLHTVLPSAGGSRNVMVAIGIQAAPAMGDPVFCGAFPQNAYNVGVDGGMTVATVPFGASHATFAGYNYATPWGVLAHAKGAETGANSTTYIDQLAQTTLGGFMGYHITAAAGAGDMTAAVIVQHSSTTTDGDFGTLLSSGTLTLGSGGTFIGPLSGFAALAKGTTVKQYIRWQLSLTLATSVTFVLAFCRNFI